VHLIKLIYKSKDQLKRKTFFMVWILLQIDYWQIKDLKSNQISLQFKPITKP